MIMNFKKFQTVETTLKYCLFTTTLTMNHCLCKGPLWSGALEPPLSQCLACLTRLRVGMGWLWRGLGLSGQRHGKDPMIPKQGTNAPSCRKTARFERKNWRDMFLGFFPSGSGGGDLGFFAPGILNWWAPICPKMFSFLPRACPSAQPSNVVVWC